MLKRFVFEKSAADAPFGGTLASGQAILDRFDPEGTLPIKGQPVTPVPPQQTPAAQPPPAAPLAAGTNLQQPVPAAVANTAPATNTQGTEQQQPPNPEVAKTILSTKDDVDNPVKAKPLPPPSAPPLASQGAVQGGRGGQWAAQDRQQAEAREFQYKLNKDRQLPVGAPASEQSFYNKDQMIQGISTGAFDATATNRKASGMTDQDLMNSLVTRLQLDQKQMKQPASPVVGAPKKFADYFSQLVPPNEKDTPASLEHKAQAYAQAYDTAIADQTPHGRWGNAVTDVRKAMETFGGTDGVVAHREEAVRSAEDAYKKAFLAKRQVDKQAAVGQVDSATKAKAQKDLDEASVAAKSLGNGDGIDQLYQRYRGALNELSQIDKNSQPGLRQRMVAAAGGIGDINQFFDRYYSTGGQARDPKYLEKLQQVALKEEAEQKRVADIKSREELTAKNKGNTPGKAPEGVYPDAMAAAAATSGQMMQNKRTGDLEEERRTERGLQPGEADNSLRQRLFGAGRIAKNLVRDPYKFWVDTASNLGSGQTGRDATRIDPNAYGYDRGDTKADVNKLNDDDAVRASVDASTLHRWAKDPSVSPEARQAFQVAGQIANEKLSLIQNMRANRATPEQISSQVAALNLKLKQARERADQLAQASTQARRGGTPLT